MAEIRGGNLGASFVASGDLSANQFKLVAWSNYNVYQPGSNAQCVGVLQNKPKHGEHAAIVDLGHTKISLAGSLACGAFFQAGVGGGGARGVAVEAVLFLQRGRKHDSLPQGPAAGSLQTKQVALAEIRPTRDEEKAVLPDDRRSIAAAGDLDLPADVLDAGAIPL